MVLTTLICCVLPTPKHKMHFHSLVLTPLIYHILPTPNISIFRKKRGVNTFNLSCSSNIIDMRNKLVAKVLTPLIYHVLPTKA